MQSDAGATRRGPALALKVALSRRLCVVPKHRRQREQRRCDHDRREQALARREKDPRLREDRAARVGAQPVAARRCVAASVFRALDGRPREVHDFHIRRAAAISSAVSGWSRLDAEVGVHIRLSRSNRAADGLSVAGPFSVVHSLDASARRRASRLRAGKPDYSRCRVAPSTVRRAIGLACAVVL